MHAKIAYIAYVVIAIALKSRTPSDMALTMAVRSAQIVKPYDAFSTLQPIRISMG